jgi:ferredoxin
MNTTIILIASVVGLWIIGNIYRNLRGKGKIIHVIEANCTGCKRCIKKCKHSVLDITGDATGSYIFVRLPDKCDACGDCVGVCKFNALELKGTINEKFGK